MILDLPSHSINVRGQRSDGFRLPNRITPVNQLIQGSPWAIRKGISGRYSLRNADSALLNASRHSSSSRGGYDAARASDMSTAHARRYQLETTRFTAANGREVIKVVTDSGVTGYIDASIPPEAIEAWYRRLSADLRRPIAHSRRMLRQNRRRTTRPTRKCTRRRHPAPRQWLPRRGRPLIVLR